MMPYAFDEFRTLIPSSLSNRDPIVRYLCALVSELAYHHVPAFEIDSNRRAKIIPCRQYIEIVNTGIPTNVLQYLREMDFNHSFVVVDRGVVAVGILLNENLFIGFRGTVFLYDWKINLRASLVELNAGFRFSGPRMAKFTGWGGGRVHRGFAEEAVRIAVKLIDAMRDHRLDKIDNIFLSGHSLGGAVAALTENFIPRGNTSTCIFGSPRYCNASVYFSSAGGAPTQIQRPGDIVPLVPPRRIGYAEHPYQFDTSDNLIVEPIRASGWPHFIWRAALFLGKGFEPHSMEVYRQELGNTAKASLSDKPLAPYEKLKSANIGSE